MSHYWESIKGFFTNFGGDSEGERKRSREKDKEDENRETKRRKETRIERDNMKGKRKNSKSEEEEENDWKEYEYMDAWELTAAFGQECEEGNTDVRSHSSTCVSWSGANPRS